MASSSWRDFERMVTAIERQLGPSGAEVRSPEHLLDKRTGLKREVDASIRYTVGSVPIVITLECRDRSQNECHVD